MRTSHPPCAARSSDGVIASGTRHRREGFRSLESRRGR
jgi:hypothetical protein